MQTIQDPIYDRTVSADRNGRSNTIVSADCISRSNTTASADCISRSTPTRASADRNGRGTNVELPLSADCKSHCTVGDSIRLLDPRSTDVNASLEYGEDRADGLYLAALFKSQHENKILDQHTREIILEAPV